jgi:hypothetical protein
MREPYFPVFKSVVDSTLWSCRGDTIKVFFTLCGKADPEGFVSATADGIRRAADLPLADVEEHLRILSGPDLGSKDRERDPTKDGRRIEKVTGGWRVLNLEYYRELSRQESRRASKRKWWNENRAKGQLDNAESSTRPTETKTETETETETKTERESPDPERARESSKSQTPEPGARTPPPQASTAPPRAPLPHEAAEARQRAKAPPEATGAQPALRYQFPTDWNPRKSHMTRGSELGLTEAEVWERVEDCRLKPIKQGFTDENKHFMRELTWAARDKETRKAKEQAYANRKDFETPGHNRK